MNSTVYTDKSHFDSNLSSDRLCESESAEWRNAFISQSGHNSTQFLITGKFIFDTKGRFYEYTGQ